MTLLTVDAKLCRSAMARPSATRALVVAFGMGSTFRAALIAGLRTDTIELVPSVPRMFGYYTERGPVLADPAGRVIIADGRNFTLNYRASATTSSLRIPRRRSRVPGQR